MKSNDLQGHLECYIYWVNWDHKAPQAYFSLPLSPQVYRAIALLFDRSQPCVIETRFNCGPRFREHFFLIFLILCLPHMAMTVHHKNVLWEPYPRVKSDFSKSKFNPRNKSRRTSVPDISRRCWQPTRTSYPPQSGLPELLSLTSTLSCTSYWLDPALWPGCIRQEPSLGQVHGKVSERAGFEISLHW